MIRARSHSGFLHGFGRLDERHQDIRFREESRHLTAQRPGLLPYSTTRSTEPPPARFSVSARRYRDEASRGIAVDLPFGVFR